MSLTTGETDVIGGGYPTAFGGGFGNGIGGLGLVGLIGLNSFLGRGPFGDGVGVPGAIAAAGTTVLEQNVSNIREEIGALGNELQAAINGSNMNNANNFRALDNRLCDSEKTALAATFQSTIQGMNNTQAIQNQASAFQVINQENFCAVKELIHADGDATRALITQNLIDGLRNELLQERRGRDNREIEINIANSATATQSQLQTQLQQQQQQFAAFANLVSDQLARQTNSMINLGTMTGNAQTNTAANTKVNS